MGTGSSLIRYSKAHTKKHISNFKKSAITFIKTFNQISQLQSSHKRNVPRDPLGTGRRSLGIRGAHFGNRCIKGSIMILPRTFCNKISLIWRYA